MVYSKDVFVLLSPALTVRESFMFHGAVYTPTEEVELKVGCAK